MGGGGRGRRTGFPRRALQQPGSTLCSLPPAVSSPCELGLGMAAAYGIVLVLKLGTALSYCRQTCIHSIIVAVCPCPPSQPLFKLRICMHNISVRRAPCRSTSESTTLLRSRLSGSPGTAARSFQ